MVTMCRIRFTHFLAPSIIASQPKSKQYFRGRLAYSGGLDTSIIIPWLKEHYDNCEVIAVCGNMGQKGELDGLEERAKASGASKLYVEDLTDEFVDNYVMEPLLPTARILPPLRRAAIISRATPPGLSPSTACPLRYRRWWKPKTNKRTGNFSYVNSSYRHQLGR